MIKHKWLGFVIAVGTLGLGASQVRAQSNSSEKPAVSAAAASKPVVPKGCEAGKRRCIGNAVRWQAAIGNADRRADYYRKHGKGNGKGNNK